MTNEEFETKFAKMLSDFNDLFETKENFERIADSVNQDLPNGTDLEKILELHRQTNFERMNNLIRIALKEFVVQK